MTAAIGWLAYLMLLVVAIGHHEPWRDEAQAWLIARDLSPLGIIQQMGYEGSPALWHFLLYPLAHGGLPYASESILHGALALCAASLFLFRSPFPLVTRLLFVFGYYMAFEYAVIARNYVLTVLVLFLLASQYRRRKEHPLVFGFLIALLAQTTVHGFFMAGAFAAGYTWEGLRSPGWQLRNVAGVVLAGLGLLAAFLQLLGPADNMNAGLMSQFAVLEPIKAVGGAFFPGLGSLGMLAGAGLSYLWLRLLFRRDTTLFWTVSGALVGLAYVFVFKSSGELRHYGLILGLMLSTLWMVCDEAASTPTLWRTPVLPVPLTMCLYAALATQVLLAGRTLWADYKGMFSGAAEAASVLKTMKSKDTVLVAYRSPQASALLPYLPGIRFWYPDRRGYGTFVTWDREYRDNQKLNFEQLRARVREAGFNSRRVLYLLSGEPLSMDSALQCSHRTEKPVIGRSHESYAICAEVSAAPLERSAR